MLDESESSFVQIGDENIHRVGMVMDKVFGAKNRMATISYATTGGSSANTLPEVADYLIWYAKDKKLTKYRQLYEPLTRTDVIEFFSWHVMVELPDGECRKPTPEEYFDPDRHLPKGSRIYRRMPLDSQGISTTGRTIIEKFEDRSDVGFAVVLLTPDDPGAIADRPDDLRPRARQNVILELGFFLGKLGRQRVCPLSKAIWKRLRTTTESSIPSLTMQVPGR